MHDDGIERSLARRDLLLGLTVALAPAALSAQKSPQGRSGAGLHSARFELERFIEDCRNANREDDAHLAVEEVLTRAIENSSAVLAALGAPQTAGIQTLYRSSDLTILNIVWAPLMQMMPHEHRMWAVSGIYTGREDNILWRRARGSIAARGAVSFGAGEVISLPDDAIHSVANPIEELTGAIHVYGGDFFAMPRSEWDPGTHAEQPWSIDKARQLFERANARFSALGCA